MKFHFETEADAKTIESRHHLPLNFTRRSFDDESALFFSETQACLPACLAFDCTSHVLIIVDDEIKNAFN